MTRLDSPIACTTDGCESVKFFPGRCNACQRAWEVANLPPMPADPYAGMSWTEECMTKVGARTAKAVVEG
jgi:hypothetical protein